MTEEREARTADDRPTAGRLAQDREPLGPPPLASLPLGPPRDTGALEALYDRYGAACYSLARQIIVDEQLAQDVVQDVFLAIWRGGRFDSERGTMATWLLTITHHKAVDAVRREQRQRSRQATTDGLEELPGSIDIAEQAWSAIRGGRVRRALGELPAVQRDALLLAYYGGHTQQEIARLTGAPLGTVKTRTLAAVRRLRGLLAGMDEDETDDRAPDEIRGVTGAVTGGMNTEGGHR